MASWIDEELAGCEFKDERLGKRYKKIITQLSKGLGKTIPLACQDWASTKAAYRLFANECVSGSDIFAGHFQAAKERIANTQGTILVLQDTTQFSFKKSDPAAVGFTRNSHVKRWDNRRPVVVPVYGVLLHSSLAVTTAKKTRSSFRRLRSQRQNREASNKEEKPGELASKKLSLTIVRAKKILLMRVRSEVRSTHRIASHRIASHRNGRALGFMTSRL